MLAINTSWQRYFIPTPFFFHIHHMGYTAKHRYHERANFHCIRTFHTENRQWRKTDNNKFQ